MSAQKQQINLYRPVVEAARAPFSARTAALLTVVIVTFLVSLWAFDLWRVQRLERTVASLRQQQQNRTQTLEALSVAGSMGLTPEQLTARVSALTAQLAEHSRALELLRTGAIGQTGGFSSRLSALARHPVDGLWIDSVVLAGKGQTKMSLAGVAIDPQLVPRYLNELHTEPALIGQRFSVFAIERPHAAETSAADAPQPEKAPESQHRFLFKAESNAVSTTADRRS
jgi:hypothetical protein